MERRPSSHDNAVALVGDDGQDFLHHLAHAFGIHHLQPGSVQAPFKAPAHERLQKPVVRGVPALFMLLDGAAITIQAAGNFFGQQLVPKLPGHSRSHLLGNLAAPASVLTL